MHRFLTDKVSTTISADVIGVKAGLSACFSYIGVFFIGVLSKAVSVNWIVFVMIRTTEGFCM